MPRRKVETDKLFDAVLEYTSNCYGRAEQPSSSPREIALMMVNDANDLVKQILDVLDAPNKAARALKESVGDVGLPAPVKRTRAPRAKAPVTPLPPPATATSVATATPEPEKYVPMGSPFDTPFVPPSFT